MAMCNNTYPLPMVRPQLRCHQSSSRAEGCFSRLRPKMTQGSPIIVVKKVAMTVKAATDATAVSVFRGIEESSSESSFPSSSSFLPSFRQPSLRSSIVSLPLSLFSVTCHTTNLNGHKVRPPFCHGVEQRSLVRSHVCIFP